MEDKLHRPERARNWTTKAGKCEVKDRLTKLYKMPVRDNVK
jgi:hypothetical protein